MIPIATAIYGNSATVKMKKANNKMNYLAASGRGISEGTVLGFASRGVEYDPRSFGFAQDLRL